MAKKKKDVESDLMTKIKQKIQGRRLRRDEQLEFELQSRHYNCLYHKTNKSLVPVYKIDPRRIRLNLASKSSIEEQIISLRQCTYLTRRDYNRRYEFTKNLLNCLLKHHGVVYEGILFGSSVNGLGFSDSDVDLRLRPLKLINNLYYEPLNYDSDQVDRTLRNIAFQTTRCTPALGDFVPSSRCPIAKISFLHGNLNIWNSYQEGLNYDISLSSTNSLGSFNSLYLRFLCQLEPRFHLLATVLRYWSRMHDLIVPGYLSSYALVNMLIFFCQTTSPPLLPTVDQMKEIYLKQEDARKKQAGGNDVKSNRGLTQLEWHCLISLDMNLYEKSSNSEPVCVLLLKFFEFCLTFKYKEMIMTTRPGRALDHKEFAKSTQYHPKFPIKEYLNIQDPFDLKHNLTSGMTGEHFQTFIYAIRCSYEILFKQLMTNLKKPDDLVDFKADREMGSEANNNNNNNSDKRYVPARLDWGLNAIFVKLRPMNFNQATNKNS